MWPSGATVAAPGFAFVLWRAGGLPGLTRRDEVRAAAAGVLVVVGYHLFLNVGTEHTTSGAAALVVALAPGMTLAISVAVGLERMRPRHAVGLVVAFAGVAVVVLLGTGEELSLGSAQGPLIVLGAPLSFALYNVLLKPLLGRHDLIALTAATSLVGTIGLVPFVRPSTVDEPGGAEVELSLLFADMRGSTGLAERMPAHEFSQLISRFYGTAAKVVDRWDGLVDKFVGDEVVALFITGVGGPNHAERALGAARELVCETGNSNGEPWVRWEWACTRASHSSAT
jgi:hypothetical protein